MANEIIRPSKLPPRSNPVASEVVPSDNGASVGGVSWKDGVNAGRPMATRAEAEAGVVADKAMSPLTTKQAIDAQALTNLPDGSVTPEKINTDLSARIGVEVMSAVSMVGASIPDGINFIRTNGYYAANGQGAAVYRLKKSGEPDEAGDLTSNGGVKRWALAEPDVNVAMLGAKTDGSEDTWPYIEALASWKGEVRFGPGEHLVEVAGGTIEVPVVFDWGAYLTLEEDSAIVIRNRIVSQKQWIFRGDGQYRMRINGAGDNGEDSRHLHASWFGVFPQNNKTDIDQTDRIIKLMAAFEGQGREGVIEFDNGAYRISAPIPVYRGAWVKGAGTRRTTFDLVGSFEAAFVTMDVACRFSNFQFETPNELGSVPFDGVQIKLDHSDAIVEDVQVWCPRVGIQINASNADIRQVRGGYGADVSHLGETSMIEVNASFARIRDIRIIGTSNAPDAIVRVGRNASANIIGTDISGIQNTENCHAVLIDISGTHTIYSAIINDIIMHQDAGSDKGCVLIKTAGSANVHSVILTNMIAGTNTKELLRIEQESMGYVADLVVSDSISRDAGPGNAIVFNAPSGSIRDITIADSVDITDRPNFYAASGNVFDVRLPGRLGGFRSEFVYPVSDDAAIDVVLPAHNPGSMAVITTYGSNGVSPNVDAAGLISFRSSPARIRKIAGGVSFDVLEGDVSGTTGVDGHLTVGVLVGKLRIENRLGSGQRVVVTWLG